MSRKISLDPSKLGSLEDLRPKDAKKNSFDKRKSSGVFTAQQDVGKIAQANSQKDLAFLAPRKLDQKEFLPGKEFSGTNSR